MDIKPRRVRARQPKQEEPDGPALGGRRVRETSVEVSPEEWGQRWVEAVEGLSGAPDSVLLRAAEVAAEEAGCSVADAMKAIAMVLERKAERERGIAARPFTRGKAKARTLVVAVEDLRPGDRLMATRENDGAVVRSVSVSRVGTGAVILFRGRDDDDGWAVRKGQTLRVRRRG